MSNCCLEVWCGWENLGLEGIRQKEGTNVKSADLRNFEFLSWGNEYFWIWEWRKMRLKIVRLSAGSIFLWENGGKYGSRSWGWSQGSFIYKSLEIAAQNRGVERRVRCLRKNGGNCDSESWVGRKNEFFEGLEMKMGSWKYMGKVQWGFSSFFGFAIRCLREFSSRRDHSWLWGFSKLQIMEIWVMKPYSWGVGMFGRVVQYGDICGFGRQWRIGAGDNMIAMGMWVAGQSPPAPQNLTKGYLRRSCFSIVEAEKKKFVLELSMHTKSVANKRTS